MKFYLILLSFLMFGFANAQVLPQGLIVNNNAYQTTISANASFDLTPSEIDYSKSQNYAHILSDFTFSFNENTPYTIQFLVKAKNNPREALDISFAADQGIFLAFATDANLKADYSNLFIGYTILAGNIQSSIYPGSIQRVANAVSQSRFKFNTNFFGRTYQITETYDGLTNTLYLNGALYAVSTRTGTDHYQTNPMRLVLGNKESMCTAVLDEVRFWDKALTQNEISNNWNKTLRGDEDGLKVYYTFDNQGYPNEENQTIKYINDKTNNYKATINNSQRFGTLQNFVTEILPLSKVDRNHRISLDANNLDSYPGNGHGFNGNNINNASTWHDPSSGANFIFYNSYSLSQLASPILTADGGRSLLFNNIYGQTNIVAEISGQGARTFEAWVKFNNLNNNSVVSIGDMANFDLFEMAVNNNKLILSTGTDLAGTFNLKSIRTLSINTWYHIVITYSPILDQNLENYIIYINGAFDNSYVNQIVLNFISYNSYYDNNIVDTEMQRPTTTFTNIFLGNRLRSFNGKLGILNIYNRMLTAGEVLFNYNVNKSRYGH
jgi:hypothetical protein